LIQRVYTWFLKKAAHPMAGFYLFFVSFIESFISPFPPDPLMIPMVLAKPYKAWYYAFICTLASVLGGLIGYYIGYALLDTIGHQIIDLYNLNSAFSKLKNFFQQYGFWIILVKGFTPIPFKVVTITCGATHTNLGIFILASFISRGMRFYLEAYLFWRWGPSIQAKLEKNLRLTMLIATCLLVLGYISIKYIF